MIWIGDDFCPLMIQDGNHMEYNESGSIHDSFSTFEEEFVRKINRLEISH